jgi:hypothetical protein
MRVLVVKSEFKDYKKGDVISDEAKMAEALESHAMHVVAADHAAHKLEAKE